MEKKERKIIYQDERQIKESKEIFQQLKDPVSEFLKEAQNIQVEIKTPDELSVAVSSSKEFLNNKYSEKVNEGNTPEFGGLRLKKEKYVEMLDLPDSTEFHRMAKDLESRNLRTICNLVQINNTSIKIDPKKMNEFVTSVTVYCEPEDEILYSILDKIRTGFQELKIFAAEKEKETGQTTISHHLHLDLPLRFFLESSPDYGKFHLKKSTFDKLNNK